MPWCDKPEHRQYGPHSSTDLIGCTGWEDILWPEGQPDTPEDVARAALAGKYVALASGRRYGASRRMKILERAFRHIQRTTAEDATFENEIRLHR